MKRILKYISNIKLRYKFILVFLCVSFIPTFILGVVFYSQISNVLVDKQKESANNYIYQSTSNMDNKLEIYNNLSDYIAFNQTMNNIISSNYNNNYEFYEQITNTLDPMLSSIKYFHSNVNSLTIYTNNIDVEHDQTIAPISNIEKESWFNKALNSTKTNWVVDKENKKIFSTRKMPLLSRQEIQAILVIDVDYDDVFSSFEEANNHNFSLFISDVDENEVYSYSNFTKSYTNYSSAYSSETNINKDQSVIINKRENAADWTVRMYYPESLSTSEIEPASLLISIIIIILMVISLIAVWFTSRFVTSRIDRLTGNIKLVENGNLEVYVESDEQDEIGVLIRGFSRMVKRIKYLIEEVYQSQLHQKEYEMRALQQQINPHFLYNTLSMINFKALEAGEDTISKMTLSLSAFYRTSLNKCKNYCSINDELKNMESYIDIQLMMHDFDFDVEIEIDEEIRQYETLNLILQPIVENAIGHGIDLLEDRRGLIKVYASMVDEEIYIMVEDNGVGMDKETMERMLTQDSKGYGMRNVNRRIKLFYGQDYGLHIESVINQGTVVTVKLPKKILID